MAFFNVSKILCLTKNASSIYGIFDAFCRIVLVIDYWCGYGRWVPSPEEILIKGALQQTRILVNFELVIVDVLFAKIILFPVLILHIN